MLEERVSRHDNAIKLTAELLELMRQEQNDVNNKVKRIEESLLSPNEIEDLPEERKIDNLVMSIRDLL